ncbi:hypothetical protein [Actinoallomurus sp. NPDC052274]|uniref:hypothetical protein n=1 Tax=Actinoallomurus sp. NPDC052274 TaxID=3155420 RepID=UPI00342B1926
MAETLGRGVGSSSGSRRCGGGAGPAYGWPQGNGIGGVPGGQTDPSIIVAEESNVSAGEGEGDGGIVTSGDVASGRGVVGVAVGSLDVIDGFGVSSGKEGFVASGGVEASVEGEDEVLVLGAGLLGAGGVGVGVVGVADGCGEPLGTGVEGLGVGVADGGSTILEGPGELDDSAVGVAARLSGAERVGAGVLVSAAFDGS